MEGALTAAEIKKQRIMVRDDKAVTFFVFDGERLAVDVSLPTFPFAQQCKFSSAEKPYAAIMDEQGIHVINCDEGKEKMMLMNVNITAFSFSPKCNYLLTCEKFGQSTMKNLTFWEIDSGNEVAHFEWRKFPKDITKLV